MQNSRFVVLTGHLSNYPLSDLVGILRHQRKTGRLTIEYPKSPGTFFFHEGELVDAQLNDLRGLQAICVALAQPEAAFNFNPLIRPSRRSIAPSLQRVVSELIGCWDETDLQIDGTPTAGSSERSFPAAQGIPKIPESISPVDRQPLQLLPAPPMGSQRTSLVLIAAAAVLTVGLSTAITLFGRLNSGRQVSEKTSSETTLGESPKSAETKVQKDAAGTKETSRTARKFERRQDNRLSTVRSQPKNQSDSSSQQTSQPASASSSEQARHSDSAANPHSINVTMQIENGRVLTASIADHKPGMESYEGLALRIAKQRRYPSKVSGQQSVQISVALPN